MIYRTSLAYADIVSPYKVFLLSLVDPSRATNSSPWKTATPTAAPPLGRIVYIGVELKSTICNTQQRNNEQLFCYFENTLYVITQTIVNVCMYSYELQLGLYWLINDKFGRPYIDRNNDPIIVS